MLNRSSPLRVEINPWTLDSTLHEVMQLRGSYVAALGTIETILTELAIRSSKAEAYSSIRSKFPSRRLDRLKFLEAVCEIQGPLSPCVGIIKSVIWRFREGLDLRDVLAHGRMQVLTGPGDDASIKLEDYYASGDLIAYRLDRWTLKTLQTKVYRAARLSRCVDLLYCRLGDRLPSIEGAYQGTTAM